MDLDEAYEQIKSLKALGQNVESAQQIKARETHVWKLEHEWLKCPYYSSQEGQSLANR